MGPVWTIDRNPAKHVLRARIAQDAGRREARNI